MTPSARDRLLGLDVGNRRIGLAVSDELRILARPLEVIDSRKADPHACILQRVRELGVRTVVVGLPVNMDGTEGPQAQRTRQFAARLSSLMPELDIVFWDERLSTEEARELSREIRSKRQRRRQSLDSLSAAIILQSYLEYLNDPQRRARPDYDSDRKCGD